MSNIYYFTPLKHALRSILVLSVSVFSLSIGSINVVHAAPDTQTEVCGQLLAEAEERFLATLTEDGSVPATPETNAAAQEYIRVSKLCYEEIEARNASADILGETPSFIDDGGLYFDNGSSAEFVFPDNKNKWGTYSPGTPGGTVTYSFMGNGISFSTEHPSYGNNVAITSLPGFQTCFITEIQAAFAAWQAVANIQFVQVSDSGSEFNAAGTSGDIRIGAHYFDGPSGTLAHAYYPPPNGTSAAGDMHIDRSENWACNASGIDIGVVALHEIGHALGLAHENTSATAIMDPTYNPTLHELHSDDIDGATVIYGSAQLSDPPINDTIANALFITIPYSNSADTTGANQAPDPNDPSVNVDCDGNRLNKGDNSVWYKYVPGSNVTLYLDTLGSSYDMYIAVWMGTPDNLLFVACDDDTPSNLQSQLVVNAQAGTSYYIQIAGYTGTVEGGEVEDNPGGNLNFHVATFGDVPSTHWAWRFIEGLNSAGVTSGCSTSPKNYCPSFTVTRDQMAVFLLKGKHGASYVPPVVGVTTGFSDVPTNHWAAAWIKQLAAEGITGGCGGGKYCPAAPVARDQMAIFLLKAKHGSSYSPPLPSGVFLDVPANHWAAAWIERLAAEGITAGCGNSNYCPATAVTRDQMAVFLLRTFNISPKP